jgi:cytochrome c553
MRRPPRRRWTGKNPEARESAGQNEAYLPAHLQAFKAGDRENEMMSVVAQNLSPTDIQNLAAYYSVIEISLGKPPLTRA